MSAQRIAVARAMVRCSEPVLPSACSRAETGMVMALTAWIPNAITKAMRKAPLKIATSSAGR